MGRRGIPLKTHCPRGHLRTPENTFYVLWDGYRCLRCRACQKLKLIEMKLRVRPVAEYVLDAVLAQIGRMVPKRPHEIYLGYTSDVGAISARQVYRALAELRRRGAIERAGELDSVGKVCVRNALSGYVRTRRKSGLTAAA